MARSVTINTRAGREEHTFYEPAEAENIGLIVVDDWRESEEGDWILSDDGWVVQVLKTGRLRRGTKWVRTPHGTYLVTGELTTAERASRFTFTGRKPGNEFRMSKRIKAWAASVVMGQDALRAYLNIFQSKNTEWAERRVVFLLKQPEVVDFMKHELKPILEKLGIDQELVIQGYLDLFREGDSDNVRLKSLNELALLTGVKEEKSGLPGEGTGFLSFGEILEEEDDASPKQVSGTEQAQLPAPEEEADAGAPSLEELEVHNEP